MAPDQPQTNSDHSPVDESTILGDIRAVNPADRRFTAQVVSPTRLWLLGLAAGIVAGIVSWLLGEPLVEHFKPKLHTVEKYGVVNQLPTAESLIATEIGNAALAFAILGGSLGLGLGLVGGLARGNVRAGLSAAGVGAVLGAVAGMAASYCLIPVFQARFDMVEQDLMIPLLTQGGIWAAVGAMGGLALGIGLGGWDRMARCVAGGLLGGVLGTVVYELAGAFVFPLDKTYQPLSETASSRLLARLAVTLCIAATAVLATQVSLRKRSSQRPTT
jgi:hypothetical protein